MHHSLIGELPAHIYLAGFRKSNNTEYIKKTIILMLKKGYIFSSGGPSLRFLTKHDGEVSEPLVGRQGSRVSMRVARASASLLSSHGRVPGTSPG